MKKVISIAATALFLGLFTAPAIAQDQLDDAALKAARKQLFREIGGVIRKARRAKQQPDLKPHYEKIDATIAKAKDPKGGGVATLRALKAQLLSFQGKKEEATKIVDDLLANAPSGEGKDTAFMVKYGKEMRTKDLAKVKELLEAAKKANVSEKVTTRLKGKIIKASLKPGNLFPDFTAKDTEGKELTLSSYKGKVVLIDFWATWCGPCMREMPNVIKAYEKYHAKGFEIIGISFDSKKEKLDKVIKAKNMTWRQYFDGKGWGNLLGKQFGISSIPATYLIGKDGKIIATNLRGDALEKALAKAYGDSDAGEKSEGGGK
jgi:peroxiredoxin